MRVKAAAVLLVGIVLRVHTNATPVPPSPPSPAIASSIRRYSGSDRLLQNPDRGFRHQFGNDGTGGNGTGGGMPNRDLCGEDF